MATLCHLLRLKSACHRGATFSFGVKEREGGGEGEGKVTAGGKKKGILLTRKVGDENGGKGKEQPPAVLIPGLLC